MTISEVVIDSRNLKRYIDAAVRREVKRYFSDANSFDIFANFFAPAIQRLYGYKLETPIQRLAHAIRKGDKNKAFELTDKIVSYAQSNLPNHRISGGDYDNEIRNLKFYGKGIKTNLNDSSMFD